MNNVISFGELEPEIYIVETASIDIGIIASINKLLLRLNLNVFLEDKK